MAGLIPQEFIDNVLNRIDLVELIDKRVPLKKKGKDFVACCPFHSEKTPSFYVNPQKQFYHCFGCGASGNAISFLIDYENLGFVDAIEELAHTAGMEVPREAGRPAENHQPLYELIAKADQYFKRTLRQHAERQYAVDYLKQRELDGETAQRFGIGYAPRGSQNLIKALQNEGAREADLITAGLAGKGDGGELYDRFRERIIFPIRDRRGRTIAFGGRALGDATPKYLNSPETPVFHKGRELYGFYEARTATRNLDRVLVVEGYMDVVALAQHGITYAVATLGTATSQDHVDQLFRSCKDIVFCFDGDRAGRAAAWRALESALPLMRDGRQAGFLFLPDGEDPDSMVRAEGAQAFADRLEQAQPFSDFLFAHVAQDVNLDTLDGRARLAELARPLLVKLPDTVFRDLMLKRLAETTGMEVGKIQARVGPAAEQNTAPARPVKVKSTPLRKLIAILLELPAVAQKVNNIEQLRDLPLQGVPLLISMLEIMRDSPQLTTGSLIERFRETGNYSILLKLTNLPMELSSAEQLEKEFLSGIKRLANSHDPYQQLLDKAASGNITEEEKERLRNFPKSVSRSS